MNGVDVVRRLFDVACGHATGGHFPIAAFSPIAFPDDRRAPEKFDSLVAIRAQRRERVILAGGTSPAAARLAASPGALLSWSSGEDARLFGGRAQPRESVAARRESVGNTLESVAHCLELITPGPESLAPGSESLPPALPSMRPGTESAPAAADFFPLAAEPLAPSPESPTRLAETLSPHPESGAQPAATPPPLGLPAQWALQRRFGATDGHGSHTDFSAIIRVHPWLHPLPIRSADFFNRLSVQNSVQNHM